MRALVPLNSITLASFNIAAGRGLNLEAISNQMNEYGVHIAGLQEIDVNTGRNNYDMLARLASYGVYPYTSFAKAIDFSGGQYGIGTVSSLPILEESSESYQAAIGENRVWQRSLVEKDGKQIAFYNTHMSYENQSIRRQQMMELIEAVNNDPAEYKAITGDFNADQENSEFFVFLDDFNLTNGHDGTWHDTYNLVDSTMKVYSIDNIITTKNLRLVDMGVVENSLSDHNMLWGTFQFMDEDQPSRQKLNFTLQEAKAIENDGYSTATWNRLQKAIAAAEDTEGCSQAEIDAIEDELKAAMAGLSHSQNKTLLQQAIAYAEAITEDDLKDVNEIVLKNFRTTLAKAKEVEADETATQAEIDEAWKNLTRAIQMLEFRSDKTELRALIAQAEALKEADYTTDSWNALQTALAHAKEIEASDTALTDSINEAAAALREAIAALTKNEFDLSVLNFLITSCEGIDQTAYSNEDGTLDAFNEALAAAKLTAGNPASQEQIDAEVLRLNAAWMNLRFKPDESLIALLQDFVDRVEVMNLALFSADEIDRLQTCAASIKVALASDISAATANQLAKEAEDLKPLLDRKPEDNTPEKKDPIVIEEEPSIKPSEETPVSERKEVAGEPVHQSASTQKSVKTAASTGTLFSTLTGAAALSVLTALRRRNRR